MSSRKYRVLLSGETFGKWTVGGAGNSRDSHSTYLCTCECGTMQSVRGDQLIKGVSTGCRKCGSRKPKPNARIAVIGECRAGHSIAMVGVAPSGMCKLCRWESYVRRTYDLTADLYVAIYREQDGKCAICGGTLALPPAFGIAGSKEYEKRAEVDHKHIPKKVKPQPPKRDTVRGLLCGGRYAGCNAKLGHVDDPVWLKAAAAYLLDPPAQRILNKKEGQ